MSSLDKFHYQLTGNAESGKKLVFLHGVMGFAANWRRIVKAFEADYQVLAYDQRGHGRSFQPAIGYAPENYAGDLLEIIDELGWQKIDLVGHSMGGRAAYYFASHYPDRVTRLVIEDIGPAMYEKGADFVGRLIDSVPVPFATKRDAREWFDTEFQKIYSNHPKREQLAEYLYANLIENEQKEAVWRFYEPGVKESIAQGRAKERWEDIADLKIPTLVIRGENSTDLPKEVFQKMLETNPLIEGIEIAGAGHWVHSDKPEQFIEALRTFFDKK
ncbi:MAG: alpha/beta hydrolase [Bdellovibrionota bacterium]